MQKMSIARRVHKSHDIHKSYVCELPGCHMRMLTDHKVGFHKSYVRELPGCHVRMLTDHKVG